MKRLVLASMLATLFLAGTALAGQKYNAFTNRWETVPDRYEMKYNPHNNNWSYQAPKARPEYNPHQNTWDWNPEPYGTQRQGLQNPYEPDGLNW